MLVGVYVSLALGSDARLMERYSCLSGMNSTSAQTDGEDWMERVAYIILEFIITSTRVWNVFINYALPS